MNLKTSIKAKMIIEANLIFKIGIQLGHIYLFEYLIKFYEVFDVLQTWAGYLTVTAMKN